MPSRPDHPTRRPPRRAAGLIRLLAGLPAGLGRSRRGSTLVLIVGALAVLSVIVVGYWAIGRGDRQTGSAVVRADQVHERIEGIRDYLRSVVGRDVLSVYAEGDGLASGDPLVLGEQTDFPFTDWDRRSEVDPGWRVEERDRRRFDPAGTLARSWRPDGRQVYPFPSSDPWLAATQPSWVSFRSLATPDERINLRRDWWQISNFSPDGRFVNLWNLAPLVNNARVANFDAPSGISEQMPPPPGQAHFISDNLFLLDDRGRATQALDFPTASDLTVAEIHRIPAAWSMRQIRAFRPALEVLYAPDDPRNAHYMWADADGDGMFDARLFELVDASLPDPADPSKRLAVPVLPHDGRYRWFVAARAIDLSALVNVNTATFVSPPDPANETSPLAPTDARRIGATPADVDLRRLLTGEDAFTDLGIEGYTDLPQPPARNAAENYSNYDFLNDGHRVGHSAFAGLTLAQTLLRPADPGALPQLFVAPSGDQRARHFARALSGPDSPAPFGLGDLVELLTYHGANDPAVTSLLERAVGGRDPGGLFQFSPLRDNRPLSLERDYLFDLEDAPQVDQTGQLLTRSGSPGPWPHGAAAITQAAADARRSLTTISGARELRAGRLPYKGDEEDPDRLSRIGDPQHRFEPGRTHWDVLAEMIADLSLRRPQDRLLPDFDNRLFDPVASATSQWQVYRPDPANPGRFLPSAPPAQPSSAARVPAREALTQVVHCVNPVANPPTETVGPVESCQLLFTAFADALLPCGGDDEAWDPSSNDYEKMRTTFYGNDPIAAVKAAAHLAVNARDMFDNRDLRNPASNSPPGAATLVLGRPRLPNQGPRPITVTHENATLTLPAGRGVPDAVFTANPGALPETLDIYGVEAQPFFTQVASYIIYTDRKAECGRTGDGADEDGDTAANDPCPSSVPNSGPITIHGDDSTNNLDFIGQVLAFQLHNPFDETVELDPYTIQFGGQTHDLPAGTLAPGATTTIVVTYPSVEAITLRIQAASSPCSNTLGSNFSSWIDAQVGQTPYTIASANPLLADEDPLTGRDVEANRVAHLWRSWLVNAPGGPRTVRMLADRIRDPAPMGTRATLDRRMDNVNESIASAARDTQCDSDNRGLSITFWGSIRRPDDPRVATGDAVPRGVFPAWCLERKDRGDRSTVPSLNDASTDGLDPESPAIGYFNRVGPPVPPGEDTLAELLASQSNTANVLVPTMAVGGQVRDPRTKTGNDLDQADHLPRNPTERRPDRDSRRSFVDVQTEVHLDDEEFLRGSPPASVLRPADLLQALAVGPEHNPDLADAVYDPGTGQGTLGDDAWTTLSEAMAMALGYDDDPPPRLQTPPRLGRTADLYEITDGGYLRLDDFAPFVNHDEDGAMVFSPGVDERRHTGIPLALNVLDAFTVRLDGPAPTLRTPVPGLINLCTAPLSALRALPMLSPPPDTYPDPSVYGPGLWWWPAGSSPPTQHNSSSDIASTVLAYRDAIALGPRGAGGGEMVDFVARGLGAPAFSGDPTVASFTFYSEPWTARGTPAEPDPSSPTPVSPTEINGLRELPGFAAVGELLAVRDLRYPVGTPPAPMDVDRLGRDGETIARADGGVDSFLYQDRTLHDELADDFDEKLAIANAAAGCASVRSDYFAVWFVVHGYQRSDVEGLRRSDMIRPSIARRFLMILDRSNVVREGDLPRMLVFKELPMY